MRRVSASTGQVGAEVAGTWQRESPGPGGWQGRGKESAGRAQGQAAAARGAGGWGISHPMVFGPDKPITWEGEDKDHLAKQDCISIIPSHLGGGGTRGSSPERAQPGPKPALLAPTPGLLLRHLAAFLRTGVSCGERGSAVTGRDSSRAWQGEARLLSALILSVSPSQAPVGSKR